MGIAQPHYLIRSSSCCRWHHHHDCRHVINNNIIIITITLSSSSSTFAIDGTATARNERNHMIVVLSPLLLGFLVCSSFRCPSSHTRASLQSRFQLRFLPHTRSPFPLAAVGSGHNEIRWVSARVNQIGGCTIFSFFLRFILNLLYCHVTYFTTATVFRLTCILMSCFTSWGTKLQSGVL